ncbi:S-layer homology domain-containing protein [uncultured Dialister sp.]|uniref:S-layer homology domain-containing protein n=1 Tax=uncultured Dialister sp. TaxID=278064 RepID=UPI00261D22D1|nr:S-layer homology domain-containing protein [uncultured Dialister sp.]
MKKILAIAAVAALTAGVSAYAANPFSDVSTDDWAYQAVSDLSDQGVVEGYPDGTFKGERNITRYELAQIIARLMAKEDQLNAEQRATLDKLAGEYADELANLGVRVSNLEKKVGNIYWSGDARMRYQDKAVDKADSWNGRMRINVKGQVNDSTYVNGKMAYDMDFKDESKDKGVYMQQLFVNHNFGKDVAVRLGRQPIAFGDQGGWLYGDANGYDGAQIAYNNAKFGATVGYGRVNASDNDIVKPGAKNHDALFAKAGYDFGFAKLGADYVKFDGDTSEGHDQLGAELYGVNLTIPVQKFNVFGEYWKNTTDNYDGYDTAWNAGLSYGAANWKKPGTWDLSVAYNDVDTGVFFGGSGLQTNVLTYLTDKDYKAKNVTFWNAIANVTLQKNVQLHAEYAFDVDTEKAASDKTQDAWTVSLNYKF